MTIYKIIATLFAALAISALVVIGFRAVGSSECEEKELVAVTAAIRQDSITRAMLSCFESTDFDKLQICVKNLKESK